MKLTLLLPPFALGKSYGGGVFNRGMLPPLGVGYLAASARKQGHQVTFIDAPLHNYDLETTVKKTLDGNPDMVGISVLTKLAPSAYAVARALKEKNADLPIIMGGAHVTSFYDQIFNECDFIDYLAPGEGEETLAELLDCLESGGNPREVSGLILRDKEASFYATPARDFVKNLDELPHPSRDIYENSLYIPLPNQCRRSPATTVITSRGCPYGKCRFCYQGGKYAASYRRRSPENVVEEIAQLAQNMGMREIIFWDDNFCIHFNWISRFCDLLDEKRLKISWTVQGRVNTVSEKMLQRMAASGCYNIYFGFESGSQEMLDFVNKGITLEQSRNAVRWAKKAGMEIRGSFIFGMPGETPEKAEETIRFACELNVDWMIFYPYHVQPGTQLGDIAAQYGCILEEAIEMSLPSYVPAAYKDATQLSRMLKRANQRYYLRLSYVARTVWRMRNPYAFKNSLLAFIYWLSLMMK